MRWNRRSWVVILPLALAQSFPGVPPLVGTRTVTLRGDIVRLREGAAFADDLRSLREQCRSLEVGDAEPRTAYLCLPAAPE
jgi:hypothetical protein